MKHYKIDYLTTVAYSCIVEAENSESAMKIADSIIQSHGPESLYFEETGLELDNIEVVDPMEYDLPIFNADSKL